MGTVTVQSDGKIDSRQTGIRVRHERAGAVTVTTSGNIDAGAQGISVQHDGEGSVTVEAKANIDSAEEAIFVEHENNYSTNEGSAHIPSTTNVIVDSPLTSVADDTVRIFNRSGGSITLELGSTAVIDSLADDGADLDVVEGDGGIQVKGTPAPSQGQITV